MHKIKLLIADDHPIVREGLKSFIKEIKTMEIIGEASTGLETIQKTKELSPHILLLDISMPQVGGLEVTQKLMKEFPKLKIIMLSIHHHKEYVLESFKSGAKGYLLKDCSPEELVTAIKTVHRGSVFLSSGISQVILNEYLSKEKKPAPPPLLNISRREEEVLISIAEGLSNKEIAKKLFISVRTVETHRENIMRKLNIHSAAGLTRYAIEKGLVHGKEFTGETNPKISYPA